MQQYVESNPQLEYPVYSTYLKATCSMVPFLFRNPGVGMNAGARPPGRSRNDDVQDFVTDVTRDVLDTADAAAA